MDVNLIKGLLDARIIEATKKKVSLKLCTIAKYMGSPIIGQYGYESVMPDFWDNNEVIEADEDINESHLGWSYDSLKSGVNFEIIVRSYGEKINLVKATYNGYSVYTEEDNEIKGYAPKSDWENHMDKLFERAKQHEKIALTIDNEREKEILKEKKKTFFQQLKEVWGYE
jgi:bifunctional DNA-binding transcriptional regulator/antitoxin component of YhaV-PrlF toxin-antitoxin module